MKISVWVRVWVEVTCKARIWVRVRFSSKLIKKSRSKFPLKCSLPFKIGRIFFRPIQKPCQRFLYYIPQVRVSAVRPRWHQDRKFLSLSFCLCQHSLKIKIILQHRWCKSRTWALRAVGQPLYNWRWSVEVLPRESPHRCYVSDDVHTRWWRFGCSAWAFIWLLQSKLMLLISSKEFWTEINLMGFRLFWILQLKELDDQRSERILSFNCQI